MQVDFLIIGQGLAGSLLAWELTHRHQKVLIIDNGAVNASQVAAGLINPVTGIRLVKSQSIESQLAAAITLYQQLETEFTESFYIEKNMYRILRNDKELEYCHKRMQDKDYAPYLHPQLDQTDHSKILVTPFGILAQKQTGYLKTRPLLTRLKASFIQRGCYRQENFYHNDLIFHPGGLQWREIKTKKLIFCDGYQAINNPWFSWLPLQPAKGEILTLSSTTAFPDKILNYGRWALPIDQSTFRTGATFDHDNINTLPTDLGKQTLINSLKEIYPGINCNNITEHQAHIRPCTTDRKPFLGNHPKIPEIMIFNGFGSKGSLQIPSYMQYFSDYLLKQTPLPQDCTIDRFYASHFPA